MDEKSCFQQVQCAWNTSQVDQGIKYEGHPRGTYDEGEDMSGSHQMATGHVG